MQLPAILMFTIAFAIGLVGILFLFLPQWITRLEARLNSRWGEREVATLRFGTQGELAVERIMNRDILSQQIVWDGWLQRHPRLLGVALCVLAAWIGWQV